MSGRPAWIPRPRPLEEVLHRAGIPVSAALRGRGVHAVALDSRKVTPGSLFIAVPGTRFMGWEFIPEAVERGAVAVLTEPGWRNSDIGSVAVPVIEVENARRAAALVARHFYLPDPRGLRVVAITGTNGKTTITYLLEAAMGRLGLRCGVIGTVGCRLGRENWPSRLTTPDPITLFTTIRTMQEGGANVVILEASSHALDQERLSGLPIECAVFTNLSRDHLDYHRDMEEYFRAKLRLFEDFGPKTAVINGDDPYGTKILERACGEAISFGMLPARDIFPREMVCDLDGSEMVLGGLAEGIGVRSRLIGLHNCKNVLAAMGVIKALGLDLQEAAHGIYGLQRVPGRLEPVTSSSPGFRCFVDYAHTPDAVEKVLSALRPLTPERLIMVVGCGGDRDRGKRPIMARAAVEGAHMAVFTADNPRSEEPEAIIEEMVAGLGGEEGKWRVVPDRGEAIGTAVAEAGPGDVVLIAGKGHESYQEIRGKRIPFSDVEEASRAVEQKRLAVPRSGGAVFPVVSSLSVLAEELEAGLELPAGMEPPLVSGLSTDSRSIEPGQLFVALRGERFDGHAFVDSAARAGASAALVDREWRSALSSPPPLPLLVVEDTLMALGRLAMWHRGRMDPMVVAITGSCGKTTTKEMVASILAQERGVLKTFANHNNLVGLPLTLLRLSPMDDAAVVELGTNRPGEIPILSGWARPDVALITNIREAHLEGFGSLEELAREKNGIWSGCRVGCRAVVNLDDPMISPPDYLEQVPFSMGQDHARVRCLDYRPREGATEVDLVIDGERVPTILLPLMGRSSVEDCLAAAAAALAAGASQDSIVAGLEAARPVPGRLFPRPSPLCRLIDDSYNANPASMSAALKTLREWYSPPWIAILGEMFELGAGTQELHRMVGREAGGMGLERLFCVGPGAKALAQGAREAGMEPKRIQWYRDTEELLARLKGSPMALKEFQGAAVLVKGSRAVGLERVVELLAGEEE